MGHQVVQGAGPGIRASLNHWTKILSINGDLPVRVFAVAGGVARVTAPKSQLWLYS